MASWRPPFCRGQNGTALAGAQRTDPREGVRNAPLGAAVTARDSCDTVPKCPILFRSGDLPVMHPDRYANVALPNWKTKCVNHTFLA